MSLVEGAGRKELSRRMPGLDLLRSLAITLVFFWHYRQTGCGKWVDVIGRFGWIGVDLFFVLSGFLIGGQLMQDIVKGQKIDFKSFYLRRFFRIMPAYLFVLVMYFIFPWFAEREGLAPLWRYLTFTQNFGLNYMVHGAFSHAWSLCIEEQFYLLLPLILTVILSVQSRYIGLSVVLGLFVAGLLSRYYCYDHFIAPFVDGPVWHDATPQYFEKVYYPTYNRLDGLLAGVSIAGVYHFKPELWQQISKFGNWLLGAGLALLTAFYFICAPLISFRASVFGFPLVALSFGLIVMAALSQNCVLSRSKVWGARSLATAAYCIYLTHKQLNSLVRELLYFCGFQPDSLVVLICCIMIALLGGSLLHVAIEKPFLRLREKILKR